MKMNKPTPDQLKAFGDTLRELCARRGMGTVAVAKQLGYYKSTVSHLFNPINRGATGCPPSYELIKRIAVQLQFTEDEFSELLAAIGYAPVPSPDESEAIAALLDKHLPRRKHKVRAAIAELLKEYTVQPRPRLETR
jgi:transcriptional regulator with XRE-family HTH domain